MRAVLVDAGPLVALFDENDAWHDWAATQAGRLPPPWLTCEAALSEALHLLEFHPSGLQRLTTMLERGALIVRFSFADEMSAVVKLLRRYATTPMSLADACLVRMAETIEDAFVLTTDGDFRVYRKNNRQVIPLIFPHEP